MSFMRRLFPCRFNEPLCQNNLGGCRCGKGGSKKAEQRANDLASQSQQQAVVQQQQQVAQAQVQQKQELDRGEAQKQAQVQAAAQEQARQQARAQEEQARQEAQGQAEQARQQSQGQMEQARLEGLFAPTPDQLAEQKFAEQRAGLSGEQLFRDIGPTADQFASLVQQRLAAPPQIPFESTLRPALDLAQQQVYASANQRGIVGSGLELEHLGRAGVDLAIKEAVARQQNAQQNQQLIQDTINQAGNLSTNESGMSQTAQQQAADIIAQLESQRLSGVNQGETAFQEALARGATAYGQGRSQGAQAYGQGSSQGAQAFGQGSSQGAQAFGQGSAQAASAYGQGSYQGATLLGQGNTAQSQFQASSLTALQDRVKQSQQNAMNIGKGVADVGALALNFVPGVGPALSMGALGAINSFGNSGGGGGGGGGGMNFQMPQPVPAIYGQSGYHGAGYANYPQAYQAQYGPPPVSYYLDQQRGRWGGF